VLPKVTNFGDFISISKLQVRRYFRALLTFSLLCETRMRRGHAARCRETKGVHNVHTLGADMPIEAGAALQLLCRKGGRFVHPF
jgi:hypothetical protein